MYLQNLNVNININIQIQIYIYTYTIIYNIQYTIYNTNTNTIQWSIACAVCVYNHNTYLFTKYIYSPCIGVKTSFYPEGPDHITSNY